MRHSLDRNGEVLKRVVCHLLWNAVLIRAGFLGVVMLLLSTPLWAQAGPGSIRKPASSVLFAAVRVSSPLSSRVNTAAALPTTQWKRGLLIGGTVGAVGLGASFFALCQGLRETNESCLGTGVAGAALGALVGGTLGALIGGQAHKRTDATATDTIPANSATHDR